MKLRTTGTRLLTGLVAVTLAAGLSMVALTSGPVSSAAPVHSKTLKSHTLTSSVFTLPLSVVGHVNLATASRAEHRTDVAALRQGTRITRSMSKRSVRTRSGSKTALRYREADNSILRHRPNGVASSVPNPPTTTITNTNVKGVIGFSALGGIQQASTKGGFDLEPPDQGLCAGGGYVMEFINNALTVYNEYGAELIAPVGSPEAFLQPTSDFFSDPRCYYDASTQRWFYQEFIVGNVSSSGKLLSPSVEFEAVSDTPDPTGTYTIYGWDTSDVQTKGCPCFGDYDNLGADANGIYVATDEFGIDSGAYNGVIVYAISKGLLETAATTGILPPVFGYRITADAFGQPYVVAPASTPAGARFAPNTEYFVESNSNAESDDHLLVYALSGTSLLAQPAPPKLVNAEVTTEGYSFPPDAMQKPGVRPLGAAYQAPAGGIQTDFNAEMEPTYTKGQIYAQLDTGTTSGTSAIDWFILKPTLSGSSLSASVVHEGFVAVKNTSLMYPYTAVNASGNGYLLFSLSGRDNYPSPAYIAYGASGATGPVRVATKGSGPDDGFTCYAAFVGPYYGGCRWGDYSMGVAMNGRIYMAAEMVPQGYRDLLTNWGTYIWSATAP